VTSPFGKFCGYSFRILPQQEEKVNPQEENERNRDLWCSWILFVGAHHDAPGRMQLPITNKERRIRTPSSRRFVNRPYDVHEAVGTKQHDSKPIQ